MLDNLLNGLPRANARPVRARTQSVDRLAEFDDFGPNPGALAAHVHVPDGIKPGAALVVVLHGCTQTAAAYDQGAGWSVLADAHGFALLFPEQRRPNNASLCFNWFEPGDTTRGEGEVASIAAIVDAVVARHAIDPARVFVTGLSAGGAMAGAMLATYPERFAGGAIIAGLPYGVAGNVQQALGAMRLGTGERAQGLADRVRAASPHRGPWPSLSIWHGTADHTVAVGNADAVVRQWAGVHGLGAPTATETVDGQTRTVWRDAGGRVLIEDWRIAGMAHGTPVAGAVLGVAGAYMLEAGISSTRHIAEFWGVAPKAMRAQDPAAARFSRTRRLTPEPLAARAGQARPAGVAAVIDSALRKAGLLG